MMEEQSAGKEKSSEGKGTPGNNGNVLELDTDAHVHLDAEESPAREEADAHSDEDDLEEGEIREDEEDPSKVKVVCSFFLKGSCTKGFKCSFFHPVDEKQGQYQMFDIKKPVKTNSVFTEDHQQWKPQPQTRPDFISPEAPPVWPPPPPSPPPQRWENSYSAPVDRFGRELSRRRQYGKSHRKRHRAPLNGNDTPWLRASDKSSSHKHSRSSHRRRKSSRSPSPRSGAYEGRSPNRKSKARHKQRSQSPNFASSRSRSPSEPGSPSRQFTNRSRSGSASSKSSRSSSSSSNSRPGDRSNSGSRSRSQSRSPSAQSAAQSKALSNSNPVSFSLKPLPAKRPVAEQSRTKSIFPPESDEPRLRLSFSNSSAPDGSVSVNNSVCSLSSPVAQGADSEETGATTLKLNVKPRKGQRPLKAAAAKSALKRPAPNGPEKSSPQKKIARRPARKSQSETTGPTRRQKQQQQTQAMELRFEDFDSSAASSILQSLSSSSTSSSSLSPDSGLASSSGCSQEGGASSSDQSEMTERLRRELAEVELQIAQKNMSLKKQKIKRKLKPSSNCMEKPIC